MKKNILILFSMFILITGCCKKPPIDPVSKLDTPRYHYLQGMKTFDDEDYLSAKLSFNRAVEINPDFGDGYAGLALVHAELGEASKSNKYLKKAFKKSKKGTPRIFLIKGRTLTKFKTEKKWLEKAQKSFDKAEEQGANISEVNYYRAEAYRDDGDSESAATFYERVIESGDRFAAAANNSYKLMQTLARVSPGTTVAEKIALMPKITRAELAALFCIEFNIQDIFRRLGIHHYDLTYSPNYDRIFTLPEDAKNSWASNWISIVLELGVMEPYPDGSFKPDKTLQRHELAVAIQSILVNLQHDLSIASKYVGEESRFPDVSSSHFAYNAMALAAERGIISPDKINGAYNPEGAVSGIEALEIIREFQNKISIQY